MLVYRNYFNTFMDEEYIDEYMKPKEVKYEYTEGAEVLYAGCYRGIVFEIQWVSTHPCCYIKVPYYLVKLLYNHDYCDYNINCHGGCTYSKDYNNGLILGWDYGHFGDAGASPIYNGEPVSPIEPWEKQYNMFELVKGVTDCIDDIFDTVFC